MNKQAAFMMILIVSLIGAYAFAEVPNDMQFQGFLTDADNAPLNGEETLTFTIYGSPEGADTVWSQAQMVSVEDGFFSVLLGGVANPLDANIFSDQPLWIGVRVGDGEELLPRTPISGVPYATRAAIADNALSPEQVQDIIDGAGYLTAFTETDPTVNALAKAILNCGTGEVAKWNGTAWVCAADQVGIEAENDPVYSAAPASGILPDDIANWNACYAWGDHAQAGYLTGYTETDPTVNALATTFLDCASGDVARWNGAEWECSTTPDSDTLDSLECENGETAIWNATDSLWDCGSLEEADPLFGISPAAGITSGDVANWNLAASWGNHASAGYLTNYTETDPVFSASEAAGITSGDVANWNLTASWGNHASAGYLTSYTETDPVFSASEAAGITLGDTGNWDAAYGWGDHAEAGYITDAYADLSDSGRLDADDEGDLVTQRTANYLVTQALVETLSETPDEAVYYAGLFWMKSVANTNMTYEDATIYCDELELGGLTDWRLPEADELRSIIVGCPGTVTGGDCTRTSDCPTCYSSGCDGCDGYQGPANGLYWPEGFNYSSSYHLSSSILSETDQGASVVTVNYYFGGVRSSKIGNTYAVRCVAEPVLTESDPVFSASVAAGITSADTTNWDAAYGWGDHADAGYLTSYDETDPEFTSSAASGIASGDITNWNTAYGWGNHADAGYLTSYNESDPEFVNSEAANITSADTTNWDSAYSWGNHANAGYITDAYTDLSNDGRLDFADDIDLVTKAQLDSQLQNYAPLALPGIPRSSSIATFDYTADYGNEDSSITIGTDGYPVIAFTDGVENDLIVVKCGDAACTSGNTTTVVDSDGITGAAPSIAIGTDGFPVISYIDDSANKLMLAKCGNAACSSGNTLTELGSSGANNYSSIAIGTDGTPIIAHTNNQVLVTHCGNTSCTSGNTTTAIDPDPYMADPSIAIGTDGLPIIVYRYTSLNSESFKVSTCANATCSSTASTVTISGGLVGYYSSMTIGTDGLPVIAYLNTVSVGLWVAKCGDSTCSSGNTLTQVDTGTTGYYSSITIGTDGFPVIVHFDFGASKNLKITKCGDAACASSGSRNLDTSGTVGFFPSIAIGTDGNPVISYYDASAGQLNVLKCTNPYCLDNWTRR